jgi:hypothetical protein
MKPKKYYRMFAAKRDGVLNCGFISFTAANVRYRVGLLYEGWQRAKKKGWRVVRVWISE